ncbi:divergent PAP2 family protein [Bacillus sp. V3-13]|uniref:divergent PAP2 family protein n=1 Tax=Bacillus sp. V3-13 TaxID=2053728 RepID=UPI0035B549AF
MYFLIPFIAWFVAGSTKFMVNYLRFRKNAFQLIGNGGFPSTHTTIVTSITMLIGFTEGFYTPIFGLAITFLYITIIDATGIRRSVGKQATVINKHVILEKEKHLRESQGHNYIEVLGGIVLGTLIAYLISRLI